jgi:cytochrome c-type protein NapB
MTNRVALGFSIAAALLALCAFARASESGGSLPLRGAAAPGAADAPPQPHKYQDQEPLVRNYPQQPPLIPHKTRDYKINLRSNKCLTCHHPSRAPEFAAPRVPDSHFKDREGRALQHVSPRRYFCVQCHVPQSDARPLVNNAFVPAYRDSAKEVR